MMKKISVCAFGAVGVLLLAVPGNAANPQPGTAPSQPGPAIPTPGLQLINTLKLHSVTRAPDVNGVFQIDVGVENVGSAPARMGVEAHAAGSPANTLLQAMNVPAHAVKHFVFADPTGGPQVCSLGSAKDYDISISNMSAATVAHKATLHASACSLSASVDSPWNHATPDSVEYTQKNALYTDNFKIDQQPTCDKSLKLSAGVYNHTASPQNTKVVVKEGAATLGSSSSLSVPKGGYVPVTLTFSSNPKVAGEISLEGGGSIANAGAKVKVTASCTYTADLDPKQQSAPSVPR